MRETQQMGVFQQPVSITGLTAEDGGSWIEAGHLSKETGKNF